MFALFRVPNRMEDLALFTRHLAGAAACRAPMPDVLRAYAADAEAGELKKAVNELAERAEAGVELSKAMEEHPKLFAAPYRRLVRLGEEGRALPGVMQELADTLEDGLKTYEWYRRAALYPLIILVILFVDVTFVGAKIFPEFIAIFQQLGYEEGMILPGTGLSAVTVWDHVLKLLAVVLLVPIGFLVASVMGLRMRPFRSGRFVLHLPMIGSVLRKAETARFANNLSLLLRNRLPMAEALGLLTESTENEYVRDAIADLHRRFEEGESLSELIASQPLFPAGMAVLVASAEDRGALADTLHSLSGFYAARTSHGFTLIREIFEPLMLLVLGIFVGLVLLSLYWPLFSLVNAVT